MKIVHNEELDIDSQYIFDCESYDELQGIKDELRDHLTMLHDRLIRMKNKGRDSSKLSLYINLQSHLMNQIKDRLSQISPSRLHGNISKHCKKKNQNNIERQYWRDKVKYLFPKLIEEFEEDLRLIRKTATYKSGETGQLKKCLKEARQRAEMYEHLKLNHKNLKELEALAIDQKDESTQYQESPL